MKFYSFLKMFQAAKERADVRDRIIKHELNLSKFEPDSEDYLKTETKIKSLRTKLMKMGGTVIAGLPPRKPRRRTKYKT